MIALHNISVNFNGTFALKGISLQVGPGVHGIVGANGAGKTTLFNCMAGLLSHQGHIEGIVREKLGFLQTEPYFFPRITGREYLTLLCQARKLPVPNLDAKNIFDLPLDRYAQSYSTGMKKKIALLGVLLLQNDVFIFDEPFNGVDIQSNIVIEEIIKSLKATGNTVFISSHIFSTLNDTCDDIYVLAEGALDKHVKKEDFHSLAEEMKSFAIGKAVEEFCRETFHRQ